MLSELVNELCRELVPTSHTNLTEREQIQTFCDHPVPISVSRVREEIDISSGGSNPSLQGIFGSRSGARSRDTDVNAA